MSWKRLIVSGPVNPTVHQQSVNAQQLQMYGENWADRLGRLLRGYGISQSRLAAVIGLSAPMISQLITGARVKISNPAVYGRIVRLEELLASPVANTADAGERASNPGRCRGVTPGVDDAEHARRSLGRVARATAAGVRATPRSRCCAALPERTGRRCDVAGNGGGSRTARWRRVGRTPPRGHRSGSGAQRGPGAQCGSGAQRQSGIAKSRSIGPFRHRSTGPTAQRGAMRSAGPPRPVPRRPAPGRHPCPDP